MTTDKDPRVSLPGRPDPGPDPDDESAAPSPAAPGSSDAAVTQGAEAEADEPVENRFPDDEGGMHRESG